MELIAVLINTNVCSLLGPVLEIWILANGEVLKCGLRYRYKHTEIRSLRLPLSRNEPENETFITHPEVSSVPYWISERTKEAQMTLRTSSWTGTQIISKPCWTSKSSQCISLVSPHTLSIDNLGLLTDDLKYFG
jgi:hypothetical protein